METRPLPLRPGTPPGTGSIDSSQTLCTGTNSSSVWDFLLGEEKLQCHLQHRKLWKVKKDYPGPRLSTVHTTLLAHDSVVNCCGITCGQNSTVVSLVEEKGVDNPPLLSGKDTQQHS